MEAIEAIATDLGVPVVKVAVTREVGRSNAKASCVVVNTNNWVGVATSSIVEVASVAVVEAYVSML
jgi:hypothetical protein